VSQTEHAVNTTRRRYHGTNCIISLGGPQRKTQYGDPGLKPGYQARALLVFSSMMCSIIHSLDEYGVHALLFQQNDGNVEASYNIFISSVFRRRRPISNQSPLHALVEVRDEQSPQQLCHHAARKFTGYALSGHHHYLRMQLLILLYHLLSFVFDLNSPSLYSSCMLRKDTSSSHLWDLKIWCILPGPLI